MFRQRRRGRRTQEVANLNGGVLPNAATGYIVDNSGGLGLCRRKHTEGKKSRDSGEAKKSGSILADMPIIGGLFKQQEAPAAVASDVAVARHIDTAKGGTWASRLQIADQFAMGNNFTAQIYASPAPASGGVRATNGPVGGGKGAVDFLCQRRQRNTGGNGTYLINSGAGVTPPASPPGRFRQKRSRAGRLGCLGRQSKRRGLAHWHHERPPGHGHFERLRPHFTR